MVSLFYARRYPAGRELTSSDQPVQSDTPVAEAELPSSTVNDSGPSDVPPTNSVPAPSDDPGPAPTPTPTNVLPTTTTTTDGVPPPSSDPNPTPTPTPTDVPPTTTIAPPPDVPTTTGVPSQSTVAVPGPSSTSCDPPPTTAITPAQGAPPSGSTTTPRQEPTNQDQQPPPSSTPAPNPTTSPPARPSPSHTDKGPAHDSGTKESVPASSVRPASGYFVPSSAPNNPQPTTTQTLGTDPTPVPSPPASSSTVVSALDLLSSSTVTSSTGALQPTPTVVLTQEGSLAVHSSSHRKYIIGGAAGGGALVLILLALLLFCCRKRRTKKDLERSGDGHSEGQPGHGQFTCCNHGTCNRNNSQHQMEQKTPLKPFILRSDPVAMTPRDGQRQHAVPPNRRESTESQKSAGSDTSTGTAYSSDSQGSQRGKRRSQKRPPPLKLTSLVTPVINGPHRNPRDRADRSSLPHQRGVPAIAVDPPQSGIPDRMRRR
jgi:hypothetical protein